MPLVSSPLVTPLELLITEGCTQTSQSLPMAARALVRGYFLYLFIPMGNGH